MKTQLFRLMNVVVIAAMASVASAQISSETIEEIRTKAEQGDMAAQYFLGIAYESGEGVAKDMRESVRWYRQAAEQGYAKAQYVLGLAYESGAGVAKDMREAVRWHRQAAEQGVAEAQYNLGVLYWNGAGVAKDMREAVRWFHQAAEQGVAAAQYNLGVLYLNGEGVAKDTREAVLWHRQAAEQGYAKAQYNLGLVYDLGEGVAKDTREAVRWYRQAAEQGDAKAQYNLGVLYWNGEGVAKDTREAVRWFHQAAEQGVAEAQHNLGVAYWNGEGVIEDEYEAYIWYSLSKANGVEKAAESLRTKKWHNDLSKTEIRAAKKEAARRLEAIDRRQEEVAEEPAIRDNIAIAAAPKGVTVAAKVFENAWRSVVVVVNGEGQGSGVIIRPNIVATNCHVVNEGGGIAVYKSVDRRADTDSAFPATIRRLDEDRDFCLLDVAGLWGVSATVRRYDTLTVGEDVYGLGAPQGLDLSFSSGLVSQLRTIDDIRYIQTDAAISPGSSGGGLFDNEGNLVGMMTSKIADESTEGIGFAIPADLALAY